MPQLVEEEIIKYIKDNKFKTGERLPSVSELMKILGAGRSTLREAIRILEAKGSIEVINGKGIFVKELRSFRIQNTINIQDEKNALLELVEVRAALEGKAVELAIMRADEQEIQKMEQHLNEYIEHIRSGEREKANKADLLFHQTIFKSAHNELLIIVIESIWDQFHKLWSSPFGIKNIFDESYPYHLSLLKAIKERDQKKAEEAIKEMIVSIQMSIKNI